MACTGSDSGKALLNQADARWPDRPDGADGMCPSAAHTAKNPDSWHEPNAQGISRAVDLTHDKATCDCRPISEALRVAKDARVRRCIFNGQQWYSFPVNGYSAYRWQPYFGSNSHSGHMHLDLHLLYDTSPWPGVMGALPLPPKEVTDVADVYGYYCKNRAQADEVLKALKTAGMPAIASKGGDTPNIYTWVPDSAAMRDYALKAGRLCEFVVSQKVADILQAKMVAAVSTTMAPAASKASLVNEVRKVVAAMEA